MPIRMVKDPEQGNGGQDNYPGKGEKTPGQRGSNPLGALLPALLGFFFKNPKIGIPVLILVVLVFVFGGGKSGCMQMLTDTAQSSVLSLGCEMDQQVYDQAQVFEPLADNIKNPLPESISLQENCPPRLNQGKQGSCVGWGSSYAARTILESKATGKDPSKVAFSPSYLYNQIALQGCQGSYIFKAMEVMQQQGVLPFSEFGYSDESCTDTPNEYERREASQFKTKGYNRLTLSGDDYKTDMLAIKQNLAQGAPVVIGMMVGGSFLQGMIGQDVWIPTASDYEQQGFGGHCMCVIGYDDYLEGGAFQIMNSWGEEWGNKGIAWVRYKDFDFFTKEAYGLYPMGTPQTSADNEISAEFGLVLNENQQNIPLKYRSDITYVTSQAVKKSTLFKMEVTNSLECYTYLFGQETDGSSYVLFPYTPKHSPYCGITGTRLFPKDHSLQADETGNKDLMAIVVTKKPIDYKALNDRINQSRQGSYGRKIQEALNGELVEGVQFDNNNGNIAFKASLDGKNAVAVVIEVDKK